MRAEDLMRISDEPNEERMPVPLFMGVPLEVWARLRFLFPEPAEPALELVDEAFQKEMRELRKNIGAEFEKFDSLGKGDALYKPRKAFYFFDDLQIKVRKMTEGLANEEVKKSWESVGYILMKAKRVMEQLVFSEVNAYDFLEFCRISTQSVSNKARISLVIFSGKLMDSIKRMDKQQKGLHLLEYVQFLLTHVKKQADFDNVCVYLDDLRKISMFSGDLKTQRKLYVLFACGEADCVQEFFEFLKRLPKNGLESIEADPFYSVFEDKVFKIFIKSDSCLDEDHKVPEAVSTVFNQLFIKERVLPQGLFYGQPVEKEEEPVNKKPKGKGPARVSGE